MCFLCDFLELNIFQALGLSFHTRSCFIPVTDRLKARQGDRGSCRVSCYRGQFTLPFGTCGLCTRAWQEEGWRKYQALKPKVSSLASKTEFILGLAEELRFRAQKLWQTTDKSGEQRKGTFFYRGKREDGRGCFEGQFIGEEQKFGFLVASHWRGCCWAGENLLSLLGYVK